MGLEGKVCVITGGGSGIGKSAALMMSSGGAKVILVGRTMSKLVDVQKQIEEENGEVFSLTADVGDEKSVQELIAAIGRQYDRVDVLVNNAGHSSAHRRLLTTTSDEIKAVVDSNLMGTIYLSQSLIPGMVQRGEGTVINISSMSGINASLLAGMAYSAIKASVINFTSFLNTEFKNTGLRASVVIPGEVDTPILDNRPVNPSRESRDTMVMPEDVAEAITLIASLPQRACIPELRIRPTLLRDTSGEAGAA